MVKIKFLGRFREITQIKEIDIDYSGTVDEILKFITQEYGPEFKEALFDDNGELKDYMKILVNGEDPDSMENQKISPEDEVVLFQTIAGG